MFWGLHFYPRAPPNKFINIQHCYWIGSWSEQLDGRERILEFRILRKSRTQFPVSGPSKITQTCVIASNTIRCIHTHTLHTHTIPKNHLDSNFCCEMLGQDIMRQAIKIFIAPKSHKKSHSEPSDLILFVVTNGAILPHGKIAYCEPVLTLLFMVRLM